MNEDRPKLLIYGDCNMRTGFGNVLDNLVRGFHKSGLYNIAWHGVNYYGGRTPYADMGIHVHSIDSRDVYGISQFPKVAAEERPDIIFALQDPFILKDLVQHRDKGFPHVAMVGWFPIDGNNIPPDWLEGMLSLDAAVTYSKFGEDLVRSYCPDINNLHMIYHGVNTNEYRILPVNDRDAKRREMRWDNSFVVGVFNRFQPRKLVPVLIRAFALFKDGYKKCPTCGNYYPIMFSKCDLNNCDAPGEIHAGHDDAVLYLHMNSQEHMMGGNTNDIHKAILSSKLQNSQRCVFMPGVDIYSSASPNTEGMVRLYNACDVFLSGTVGEGFGLTAVEAMACGLPVIIPNNTTAPEFFGDGRGTIIPSVAYMNMPYDSGHLRPVFSHVHAVDALCKIYNIQKEKGYIPNYENHFWVKKNLNWGNIVRDFNTLILNTLRTKRLQNQSIAMEVY